MKLYHRHKALRVSSNKLLLSSSSWKLSCVHKWWHFANTRHIWRSVTRRTLYLVCPGKENVIFEEVVSRWKTFSQTVILNTHRKFLQPTLNTCKFNYFDTSSLLDIWFAVLFDIPCCFNFFAASTNTCIHQLSM